MNSAQKTKAAMVEIALSRLQGRTVTVGEAFAIQAYMALLNRRQEAAFNKAINKAIKDAQIQASLKEFNIKFVERVMNE